MVRYENTNALAFCSYIVVKVSSHNLDLLLSDEDRTCIKKTAGANPLSQFRAGQSIKIMGFPAISLTVVHLVNRNLFLGPLFCAYKLARRGQILMVSSAACSRRSVVWT